MILFPVSLCVFCNSLTEQWEVGRSREGRARKKTQNPSRKTNISHSSSGFGFYYVSSTNHVHSYTRTLVHSLETQRRCKQRLQPDTSVLFLRFRCKYGLFFKYTKCQSIFFCTLVLLHDAQIVTLHGRVPHSRTVGNMSIIERSQTVSTSRFKRPAVYSKINQFKRRLRLSSFSHHVFGHSWVW